MSPLGWILLGFLVSFLARALLPLKEPLGVLGTSVLGMGGALLMGWLGHALGWVPPHDELLGFGVATLGAVGVLGLYYGLLFFLTD
ncbi:MAG: GlsB/YeaQ/YmgE family stress response membrane protein [Bdellovibrionia bacterium]